MKRIGFILLVPLALITTIAVPAAADGQQACTTDTTVCATYSLEVNDPGTATAENHAATPADLTFSASNTSPLHATDTTTWWSSISVSVLRGLGNAVYTPSAKLDPGLLIAGTSSDCAPDAGNGYSFSSCTAGYGTFYANVSGTSGLYDGIHQGTFGIERIANVGQTAAGELDWSATVEYCLVNNFLGCNAGNPQSQTFELAGSVSSGSTGTITIPTTTSFSYGTVSVSGSLDSITGLHLLGRSGTLSNGSAAPHGTQTVLHLPDQCGTADVSLSATDNAPSPATVKVPVTLGVIGCPTAVASASETKPYTVSLDAHRSSVGTAGRHLNYQWSFNGGHPVSTTKPTVTHTFATSKPAAVQLIAVDSLGAMSQPVSLRLKGSKLTIKAPAKARPGAHVKVSGRLTGWPNKPSLGHRTVVLERCRTNATHCSKVATLRTNGQGKWSRRTTFSRSRPVFVATFNGGHGYLGTRAHRAVRRTKAKS